MRSLWFICFALIYLQSEAQPLKLVGKKLTYDAYFLNAKGDTTTRETIDMEFQNTPWRWDNSQNNVKITYHTDHEGIKDFVHPMEKRRKNYAKYQQRKEKGKKGYESWTWLDTAEVTGYDLQERLFWTHPPRQNQYVYTELAGMPTIYFNKLKIGGSWQGSLSIMMGWGEFKGTLVSKYKVMDTIPYNHHNIELDKVWQIAVQHEHSTLGKSSSNILFDENSYGFIMLDQKYYDDTRMIMKLKETN